MNICLFTPQEIQKPLSLKDERAQHIIKILHKKESESFSAGIINGCSGIATITAINTQTGELEFSFTPTGNGKPLYPLEMIVGFPRPIQLKRLLRDMAGLGVRRIYLTATELGEKSYLNSELATPEAGKKMLLEGTIQAAGTHVPDLYIYSSLCECLTAVKKNNADSLCAVLENARPNAGINDFIKEQIKSPISDNFKAVAAIGSERGWTQKELELFDKFGYSRLSMGIRVLRTETAATVAASLLLGAMGFLN